MKKKKHYNHRLYIEDMERLAIVAKELGYNTSQVVRHAISLYLKRTEREGKRNEKM